jgi:hypothetical protein
MRNIIIPAIVGIVALYLATIYFRYEPIPSAEPNPNVITVWDRFDHRVCWALPPSVANAQGIACTPNEVQTLFARPASK